MALTGISILRVTNDVLEKVMQRIAEVMTVLLLGINTLEITSRNIFTYSFSWVQELSLLLLVFIVFFGGCVVIRKKRDVALTIIMEKVCSENIRKVSHIICNACSVILLLILLIYGCKLQFVQAKAMAMHLPITMNWFSLPILIFSVITLLFIIEDTIKHLRSEGLEG